MNTFARLASILFLAGLTIGGIARAGICEPDTGRTYRADARYTAAYEMTPADLTWVESLVQNLQSKGGHVAKHHVFLHTDGTFTGTDVADGAIYVNRDNPDEFITIGSIFVINFATTKVDMFVRGAQSLHLGPHKNFIVVIDAVGAVLGGIPVWSGGIPPEFAGRVVTWH